MSNVITNVDLRWDPAMESSYNASFSKKAFEGLGINNFCFGVISKDNSTYLLNNELKELPYAVVHKLMFNKDGRISSWNTGKDFYLPTEDRKAIFFNNLRVIGDNFGINAQYTAMVDQTLKGYVFGNSKGFKFYELTADEIKRMFLGDTFIRDKMIWNYDKPGQAIVLKKSESDAITRIACGKTPAIMHPAADCTVITAYDPKNGILSMLHAGLKEVALGLPYTFVKGLNNQYGCDPASLVVSIGPCGINGFTYPGDKIPEEVKNNSDIFVNDFIIPTKDGKFELQMLKSCYTQLTRAGISADNISLSNVDSLTDPGYFSNAGHLYSADSISGRNGYISSFQPVKSIGTIK